MSRYAVRVCKCGFIVAASLIRPELGWTGESINPTETREGPIDLGPCKCLRLELHTVKSIFALAGYPLPGEVTRLRFSDLYHVWQAYEGDLWFAFSGDAWVTVPRKNYYAINLIHLPAKDCFELLPVQVREAIK